MDEEWKTALEGFDGVWQRVQERTAPPALPEVDRGRAALAALLQAVADAAAAYRAAGARSQTLQRMAGECLAELRRLQAGWFLLYGETNAPTAAPVAGGALSQRLRQAYFLEKAVWEAGDAAAIAVGDVQLRALCAQAAQRSRARLDTLFSLLCIVLGRSRENS